MVYIVGRLGVPDRTRMPVELKDKHARLFTAANVWLRVKAQAQRRDDRAVADTDAADAADVAAADTALIDSAKLAAAEAPWNPMFRKLATT